MCFASRTQGLFQLTAGPMLFRTLTPSPDGKKLFVDGFQARGELIRYDAQRRGFVPFLSGISASDLRFSRDGKWVAYVSYPEGTLWRSRVDGSDRLQLTSPPFIAALPNWSPDGTQIAFEDLQTGLQKIFLISANGGVGHELLAENLAQCGCRMVPGRQANSLCSSFNEPGAGKHPSAGFEFQSSVDRSGLAGLVFSSLVPRWPVHCRPPLRL